MAVVGEARIVVRAITTGVAEEISRALKQAQANVEKDGEALGERLSDGFSRGFGKKKKGIFGDLFDKDAAEKARSAFAKLQKTGMTMQTAFGTIASSIGSLVVALGALAGSAGGAAVAMVAVAGAGVGLGLGMKLAGMALGGVTGPMKAVGKAASGTKKTIAELREEMQQLRFDSEEAALSEKEAALNLEKARENLARVQDLPPNSMARREAELSYEQADLALRRAIDRNNDLQEEIKNGPKQDSGAGADPYAGLTKSQKAFARTLVKLKPKFDALKEAVAKGFLPLLGDGIDRLMTKNFPTLERGFTRIGDALGTVAAKIFDVLDAADGTGALTSLFETSAEVIESLGSAFADYFAAFLDILDAASPLTRKFVDWIQTAASDFRILISTAKGDGSLTKFFNDAGRVAADFGDIFHNIFSGFGALISDSLKPGSGGDMLVQWLRKATDGFANMGKDPGFSDFIKNSTTNALKMFDALGEIIDIIIGMADDPSVGKFWDTIAKAADPLQRLLENGTAASDELADLIVQVTEVAAAFGDQGQLEAFFGTLRDIAKTVADFLNQKDVKNFLNVLGPIVGSFLAFGTAIKIAAFYFKALVGTFNLFATPFRFFFKKDAETGKTKFKELKDKAADAFKKMREGFDKFKEKAKAAFEATKKYAKQAFDDIKTGLKLWKDAAVERFNQFKEAAKKAFDNFKEVAKKAFDDTKTGLKIWKDGAVEKFSQFKSSAASALDSLKTKASSVLSTIGNWAKDVGKKLAGVGTSIAGAAGKAAGAIGDLSKKVALNTIEVFKNIGAWIAQKVALVKAGIQTALMTVKQVALRIATAIGTGIQAAFNFVMAMNPITLIVIAIVALVAALIWFFTQTEIGKQIWQGFMDFMKSAFDVLMAAFKAVGDFFVAVWNGLVAGVKFVFDLIVAAIMLYINIWITIFKTVIAIIVAIWNGLVDGIKVALDWVVGIFKGAWEGVSNFFKGFINGLIGMFEGFINFFINGINLIIDALGKLNIKIPDWVPLVGGQTWGIKLDKIPAFKLPRLAKGGVVSPSAGGSLVNVAEAGKPERIEPLDENGMSKRDKVIMDALSKGGGSGINMTINPSAGMDEVELANLVSRQLAFQLRAGGI